PPCSQGNWGPQTFAARAFLRSSPSRAGGRPSSSFSWGSSGMTSARMNSRTRCWTAFTSAENSKSMASASWPGWPALQILVIETFNGGECQFFLGAVLGRVVDQPDERCACGVDLDEIDAAGILFDAGQTFERGAEEMAQQQPVDHAV